MLFFTLELLLHGRADGLAAVRASGVQMFFDMLRYAWVRPHALALLQRLVHQVTHAIYSHSLYEPVLQPCARRGCRSSSNTHHHHH